MNYLSVNKNALLLIAGAVWLIAGFNIMRIGIFAYHGYVTAGYILLAFVIYLLFHNFVFRKMVKKHAKRILSYENMKQSVFKFFNKQAYFIMGGMITFGVALRFSGLMPEICIAVFYSGLGFSLVIAGVSFMLTFLRARHAEELTGDMEK